ncbi:MAG: Ig-like domain-containing protein [Caldilineales bacterium]|nr:Ig-like domain-containing protein [Caldilineales bacterium]
MKTARQIVPLLLILVLLITSCGRPPETPTPQPTPQPTVQPLEVTPTPPVEPTPTPELPPVVVSTTPGRGQEHPLDEPIRVRFSQPMDPASTQAAFAIEPAVPGQVQVAGDELTFIPAQPLARGEAYRIAVSEAARGLNGKALAAPVQVRFQAVGFLRVTTAVPADGSQEVSVDTPITVVFNRPVVPMVGVAELADLPQPLRFDPPVGGQGEWLTTSIYTFRPSQPLAGATSYRVTVPAGLQDTKGGLLAEDYTFTFRTASPMVVGFQPEGTNIAPTTAITVTFSQPMDRASAEAAFSLRRADGRPTAGAFTWSRDGRSLRYQPAQPLEYGTAYNVQVSQAARSANGQAPLREAYATAFETVPKLALVSTTPADGEQSAPPEDRLTVVLRGRVDEKSLGASAFTILPKPTAVFSYFSSYENRWFISWPLQPQTAYTVTLSGEIRDVFGNRLNDGRGAVIRFRTGNRKPFAHLNVPMDIGTYNTYTNTLIAASYRNVSALEFSLYSVDERSVESLLGPNRWQAMNTFQPSEQSLVRRWTVAVSPPPNENVLQKFPLAEDGGPLPPGVYWVEMRAPEVTYGDGFETGQLVPRHLLVASPLNLVTKKTADEVLVWATDLQSGQPVANLPVRVAGAARGQGTTDQDGIARIPIRQRNVWEPLVVFAGRPGDRYGVVSTEWNSGIQPWDFDLSTEFPPPQWQLYFYLDRPLYRPGHTVYWRGIVRADEDAIYRLPPAGTRVQVSVRNPQGELIYDQPHTLSAFGTLHGELRLADEAPLGYYFLEARLLDQPPSDYVPSGGVGFNVLEYRKPEFTAELTTDREEYLNGDRIAATVQATYFFGGPVTNAKVQWTVYSQDAALDFRYAQTGPWYSFGDFTGWDPRQESRFGGLVASGEGVTDSSGRFTFTVPADISDRLQSQRFTLDARISDLNNQESAASANVLVHKGLVYVGVAPREYVVPVGQESTVDLITVDWESRPVPNQRVTVTVNRARWTTVQEKGEDGRFYWVSRVQETPILTEELTTDSQGQAVLRWRPEAGGEYKINAAVTDSRGNTVRSAAFLWVSDRPTTYVPWRVENNDRITLVADKRLYRVGDTARVLAPHPYQGPVEALLTIERGRIIEARRITLEGNSPTLEIPIRAEYLPNVFVSLVIVKGGGGNELGSYKVGYVELPVDIAPQQLQVTLTPNKPELRPGETVTFTVEVRDDAGRPVQGEFSLALVDKALLALTWQTDPPLDQVFYRRRGVGVQTASSLVYSLDRLNQLLQEGSKGGGGGDGLGVDVRTDFQDTALWVPNLVTDASGRGVVSVRLPDNLTTWRLDARGVTADTQVGQATVEIRTSLPLMVRPVLPRFFTAGDEARIAAVVNNNTAAPRTVAVGLVAPGLSTSAPLTQTVDVPAGNQVKVEWPVVVEAGREAVTVRFTAVEAAGDAPLSDAVELTLPVYRYSSPETVATAGAVSLNEERLEVVVLPPDVDPTQGELRVRLDPSLAAGMVEGLRYVNDFPYDCTEQIVSKFLVNVVNERTLRVLQLDRPDLAPTLHELVSVNVQRLLARQNPDGGWGWWPGRESNLFVSAYAVYGLVEARRGGYPVDDAALARAVDYLQRQLKPAADLRGYELNQQAFVLFVLAEAGAGDMARSVALFDVRERLGHYGRAFLALAFHRLSEAGEAAAEPRGQDLLQDLQAAAVLSATGAHWEEEGVDWWTMNSDARSTAVALLALTRLSSSGSPGASGTDLTTGLLPNVVRWLMLNRRDGRWDTTQDNVWAIVALTDWMQATGELEADYTWRVDLNFRQAAGGVASPTTAVQPVELRIKVANLLLDAANALSIVRFAEPPQTGAGQLYYTAHLNYYLPAASLPALNRGMAVDRTYGLLDPVTRKPKPGSPLADAQIGDTVQVTVTLVLPNNAYYLVVESPLPAGFEAIDPALATTSGVYRDPGLQRSDLPWFWEPTRVELRDEKVALFAEFLPAGTYQFRYQMRASLPGRFQTLPAVAYQMYFPETWGRSAGELFTVQGR